MPAETRSSHGQSCLLLMDGANTIRECDLHLTIAHDNSRYNDSPNNATHFDRSLSWGRRKDQALSLASTRLRQAPAAHNSKGAVKICLGDACLLASSAT